MGSTCAIILAKCVLYTYNFLFSTLGVIAVGAGAWSIRDRVSLVALLKTIDSLRVLQFVPPAFVQQLAHLLILFGGILLMTGLIGCCGTVTESRCLLIAYVVWIRVLLVVEITGGLLIGFAQDKKGNNIRFYMQSTISNYTAGELAEVNTLMWNRMMSSLSCCGIDDYEDLEMSSAWAATKGNHIIPAACCVLKHVEGLIVQYDDCVTNPTDRNSFYQRGCYDVFIKQLSRFRRHIFFVILGIGFLQVAATCLACQLARAFSRTHNRELEDGLNQGIQAPNVEPVTRSRLKTQERVGLKERPITSAKRVRFHLDTN